jgi:anhydro-N-acetylmuramic acid kinase
LRERLQVLASGAPLTATDLGRVDTAAGRFIAEAINRLLAASGTTASEVEAIGSHGQTVAHAPDGPEPTTIQLGDANVIAELTGIDTVSDFRRRDLAAGGQGAPLAPAFHNAMLRSDDEDRVVLNLGGIANITLLPADPAAPVTGFDTGPANCLMDLWARQHLGLPFDQGGQWASGQAPDPELLERMRDDPFFSLPPPKSTGTQYFSRQWLGRQLEGSVAPDPQRVQATLLALTVTTIRDAIVRHAPACQRVLVGGGGVGNRALVSGLRERLQLPVEPTSGYGIHPEWMEPVAFAWLAAQTLARRAGNLPSVTGAAGARVLGTIHPA